MPEQSQWACPQCALEFSEQYPRCPQCGLSFEPGAMNRITQIQRQIFDLEQEQRWIMERLTPAPTAVVDPPAPPTPPAEPVPQPVPEPEPQPEPEPRPEPVPDPDPAAREYAPPAHTAPKKRHFGPQHLLFGLGGLLLLSGLSLFVIYIWIVVGVAAQAAIMGTLTLLSFAASVLAAKRGLGAAAETAGIIAVGLFLIDATAAFRLGLLDFDTVPGGYYAAGASLLGAGLLGIAHLIFVTKLSRCRPVQIYLPGAIAFILLTPWFVMFEQSLNAVTISLYAAVSVVLAGTTLALLWRARRAGARAQVDSRPVNVLALITATGLGAVALCVQGLSALVAGMNYSEAFSARILVLVVMLAVLAAVGVADVRLRAAGGTNGGRWLPYALILGAAPYLFLSLSDLTRPGWVLVTPLLCLAEAALVQQRARGHLDERPYFKTWYFVLPWSVPMVTFSVLGLSSQQARSWVENWQDVAADIGELPTSIELIGPLVFVALGWYATLRLRSTAWPWGSAVAYGFVWMLALGLADADATRVAISLVGFTLAVGVAAVARVRDESSETAPMWRMVEVAYLFAGLLSVVGAWGISFDADGTTALRVVTAGVFGLAGVAYAGLRGRLPIAYVGVGSLALGIWVLADAQNIDTVEAYSAPLAIMLALIALVQYRRYRATQVPLVIARQALLLAPAVGVMLVPTALVGLTDNDEIRLVLVALAGVAIAAWAVRGGAIRAGDAGPDWAGVETVALGAATFFGFAAVNASLDESWVTRAAVLATLGLATMAYAIYPQRAFARYVAALLLAGSTWVMTNKAGLEAVEFYSVPLATLLAGIAWLQWRTWRRTHSDVSVPQLQLTLMALPTLTTLLGPTFVYGVEQGDTVRMVVVSLVATGLAAGARVRQQRVSGGFWQLVEAAFAALAIVAGGVGAAFALDHSYPSGVIYFAGFGALAWCYALGRRQRLPVGYLAAVVTSAAIWTVLEHHDIEVIEAYSVPLAVQLLAIGSLQLRNAPRPYALPRVALVALPTLTTLLLPTFAYGAVHEHPLRLLVVALSTIGLAAFARWRAVGTGESGWHIVEGSFALAALLAGGLGASNVFESDYLAATGYFALLGAATWAYALGLPSRLPVAYAASVLISMAVWIYVEQQGVEAVEAYSLPLAVQLVAIGVLLRKRVPAVHSLLAMGPWLVVGLVPSMSAATETGGVVRLLVVTAAAIAVLLLGLRQRQLAPILVGALVLAYLAVAQGGPYLTYAPNWLLLTVAGVFLLSLALMWERAINAGRRTASWLKDLR